MALQNLKLKPGVYEETTDRGVGLSGFWKDVDRVRFRNGFPEKIGGWLKQAGLDTFIGTARGVVDWQAISTFTKYIAFGTSKKLYVMTGGMIYDITPLRESGQLTNPFTTTINSPTVGVADVGHGLSVGHYVNFNNASAVGGITVDGNYIVATVVDVDNYTITHTSNATSTAGPGGGTVDYGYEIAPGVDDSVAGLGYGIGTYGSGTYGTARSVSQTQARTWSLDTWGEDLIACHVSGSIYVWDSSVGPATSATLIAAAPTNNLSAFVSTENRHLIALGAGSDPLLVQWCHQEDYNTWTSTITNTAGDRRLDVGSKIITWAKIRGSHLIFTDAFVYSMQFAGPPYTFTFSPLGDSGGIRGPNAVHVYEGIAYWMGEKEFYVYDGAVQVLPCSVATKVFGDINSTQNAKVWGTIDRAFREVWWLYTSEDATENDRYVVYNIDEKTWYYGTMDRTILVGDSDIFELAYGFSPDGYIYDHNYGVDDDVTAMSAYVETGDIELDPNGTFFQHLSKYVPDFQRLTGSVDVTFSGKRYPQDTATVTSGPHSITSTTKFVNPRMRVRQMSMKIQSSDLGDDWRSGIVRLDLLPHGKR